MKEKPRDLKPTRRIYQKLCSRIEASRISTREIGSDCRAKAASDDLCRMSYVSGTQELLVMGAGVESTGFLVVIPYEMDEPSRTRKNLLSGLGVVAVRLIPVNWAPRNCLCADFFCARTLAFRH